MTKWNFPGNNNAEIIGFSNPGVEQFRGTPLKSLTREICQNSLDATREWPVKIEFDEFRLPSNQFPDVEGLCDALKGCVDWTDAAVDKTANNFFKTALKTARNQEISCLRISDFNTRGLEGSNGENYTSWVNLVRSSGVSDKAGTAGGAFGIGKYATYAVSELLTVFYTTIAIDGLSAFQGVSRLATFRNESGETTSGIGYFGSDHNRPITEHRSLQPTFVRRAQDYGTDIFIAGFKYYNQEWEKEVISAVFDDYLVAILEGKIEVTVRGKCISKHNLTKLVDDYKDVLSPSSMNYFRVLSSPKTCIKNFDIQKLGDIEVRLLIDNDLHKKVAMIRGTGMKIKDQGSISNSIQFAGVVVVRGEMLNNTLRKLESPEHTDWMPARSPHPPFAKALLKQINDTIKEYLNEIAMISGVEDIDAIGVGDFLPEIEKESTSDSKKELFESGVKRIEKTEGKPNRPTTRIILDDFEKAQTGEEQEDGSFPLSDSSKNTEKGEAQGTGSNGDLPAFKFRALKVQSSKVVIIDEKENRYRLYITPAESIKNGFLSIYISAEKGSFYTKIINAEDGRGKKLNTDREKITNLDFRANQKVIVEFSLDYPIICALGVNAYANI